MDARNNNRNAERKKKKEGSNMKGENRRKNTRPDVEEKIERRKILKN